MSVGGRAVRGMHRSYRDLGDQLSGKAITVSAAGQRMQQAPGQTGPVSPQEAPDPSPSPAHRSSAASCRTRVRARASAAARPHAPSALDGLRGPLARGSVPEREAVVRERSCQAERLLPTASPIEVLLLPGERATVAGKTSTTSRRRAVRPVSDSVVAMPPVRPSSPAPRASRSQSAAPSSPKAGIRAEESRRGSSAKAVRASPPPQQAVPPLARPDSSRAQRLLARVRSVMRWQLSGSEKLRRNTVC